MMVEEVGYNTGMIVVILGTKGLCIHMRTSTNEYEPDHYH